MDTSSCLCGFGPVGPDGKCRRCRELAEATATGPERDLADLERIARTYKVGMSMHHFERPCAWACDGWVGWLISVNQDGNWFLNPSNPEGDGESCNFAEALALLKGAKDA